MPAVWRHVQSHISGVRPEMAAHLWSAGYSVRVPAAMASTPGASRDGTLLVAGSRAEHAVGS